ncbi:MAG: hydrogenase expression/formation protein HypE [Latescibacteria bacterium DG_63]|uniref:Hydrogenase expression/formation protein HypE n=1 Tax=candidate division TA06 bacterium SM23_40 TaxID=1703774 RepID=A0A0S8G3P2_UNCT6|nr:MAG: hydrogenase expression/formation protein HypE [Latescibacteria bacterium DG_63]KPK67656.1 MAG: hydrogenase expression/formation protein HypE [candidate division TA06 bacterium SM23_40]
MATQGTIRLAHGSGGKLTHDLVERMFLPRFRNAVLEELADAARVAIGGLRLAFTTDSYVVKPLFFPGGDIGRLAVSGTVNDLAVVGARPLFVSSALIIEEGIEEELLVRVTDSMHAAAAEAGVEIVAGDTKVVEKGGADGLFINTSGLGVIDGEIDLGPHRVKAGDRVLVSGSVADHGIAVMAARQELGLEPPIETDCAPLGGLVADLLALGQAIRFMRDPTRGGVAMSLNEMALQAEKVVVIDETEVPVKESVRSACELLGFDPLYVANEGKVVAIVAAEAADEAIGILRQHPLGRDARLIGEVADGERPHVVLRTAIGGRRIVDMPVGEQLPRIC